MNDHQLDPQTSLDAARFMDYEHSASRSPLVERVAGLLFPGATVCDVGGATGRFLAAIESSTGHSIDGAVLEVAESYRSRLVDPRYRFIHSSILSNDVSDGAFDLVTARHVLHHLVADDHSTTRRLQIQGMREMLRITKPGGHLAVLEEVNSVRMFSRIVYWASLFASRHKIRIGYFDTGKVVVSFLTPKELHSMIHDLAGAVIDEAYLPRPVSWRWRLTILMAPVKDALVLIQKGT